VRGETPGPEESGLWTLAPAPAILRTTQSGHLLPLPWVAGCEGIPRLPSLRRWRVEILIAYHPNWDVTLRDTIRFLHGLRDRGLNTAVLSTPLP
jgi:hypothetical protein